MVETPPVEALEDVAIVEVEPVETVIVTSLVKLVVAIVVDCSTVDCVLLNNGS